MDTGIFTPCAETRTRRRSGGVQPRRPRLLVLGARGGRGGVREQDEVGPPAEVGRGVAGDGGLDGHQRSRLPICPHGGRGDLRGDRWCLLQPRDRPQLARRADRWRGLDRHCPGDLLVLAAAPGDGRRLPLWRALEPGVRAAVARGEPAPTAFSALPYLMTIVALVVVSNGWGRLRLGAPAALGQPYLREER